MGIKILITGGTGMVGSAFKEIETSHNLIFVNSSDYNLLDYGEAVKMFVEHKPDACIHLAAVVGGIKANTDFVADFCAKNITINTNILRAANHCNINKVLSLLSTCIYPDEAHYPLTEDQIHNGRPHYSNFGYAYAKRMSDVLSRSYRRQYGRDYITVVPNNLFGKNDNFDLENSHVIPAIIRKMYEAKINNQNVRLWGDGSPLREFTYSPDLAKILLFLVENYNGEHPINVGNTIEISIKQVAETVAEILNFDGEIIWDTTKPNGQLRKPSDNSKLINLGWDPKNYTNFKKALTETCKWVIIKYPNLRGI